MRFLLVNLDWPGLVSKKTFKIHLAVPPLDLLLLADQARDAGSEVKIFDRFVQDPSELPGLIQEADWIIIATTPYHMWQCPNSEWDWVKLALERFPKDRSVLTGLHCSVFPEKTLRETGVHAIVRREPEVVFKRFLQTNDWRACEGVSYLDGETFKENPLPQLPTMDELTVRNYEIDISRYGYFLLGKNTGVFEASRGCPWKCTFCDQEMYSWNYRTKSAEVFAEEVSRAVKRVPMKTAYFYDLEFTIQTDRTIKMCEELIRLGVSNKLRWACQTRADMINEEMLDAMKAAGCVLIHFGVESANPEILKATNKKITLDKIQKGVGLAKAKGFQTACFFMFGLPDEKPTQFDTTLEFARALNPTYASFHFAIPFPGTPLYDRYIKEKNLPWGVWPATYFDGWPHDQVAKYITRAYRKFYVMPKRFEPRQFMYRLHNLPHKLSYFASVN